MTTSRRQHHVWRRYLEAWSTGGQIQCLQDGRVFGTNVVNVAVQRDFYKLHTLTDADLLTIRLMFGGSSPAAKKVLDRFIAMFGLYGRLRAEAERHGGPAEDQNFLRRQMTVAEEDWHAELEGEIGPVFEAIRRRDMSFYSDPDLSAAFTHFLSLQHFRTRGLKERMLASVAQDRALALLAERHGFSLQRSWNIVVQMFAVNVGAALFAERNSRPLVLLENTTDTPFVTGDQPVVNLLGARTVGEPTKLVALYYPVSPWLAVVLDEAEERCGYGGRPVSPEQVARLNREILAAAHKQVFGHSREVLLSLAGDAVTGGQEASRPHRR